MTVTPELSVTPPGPPTPPTSSIFNGRPSSFTPLYVLIACVASWRRASTTSAVPLERPFWSKFRPADFTWPTCAKSSWFFGWGWKGERRRNGVAVEEGAVTVGE